MSTYLISDTFFGREEIARERGFSSAKTMNEHMIKLWNSRISAHDTVYHLGNFGWDPVTLSDVIDKLNGRIFLLPGNLDKAMFEYDLPSNYAIYESLIVETIEESIECVFGHYPMLDWNGKDQGVVHFHGHNENIKSDPKINRINVMADLWNLTPQRISVLSDVLKDFKNGK